PATLHRVTTGIRSLQGDASGKEALQHPRIVRSCFFRTRVAESVMQPERLPMPKLHHLGFDAEPRPMRGTGAVATLVLLFHFTHPLFEDLAVFQRLRLQRRPGADLAAAIPRRKILV